MATILIVDDEPAIVDLASAVARSLGHTPMPAHNGLEAISLFRSYPDRINLILTDLIMPVMDGYALIDLARQTRPDIRIVCMSAHSDRPLPTGVHCLQKPFALPALQSAIADNVT